MIETQQSICPRCQLVNRGAALFCAYCGGPMPLPGNAKRALRYPNWEQIAPETGWWSRTDGASRRLSRLGVRGEPRFWGSNGLDIFLLAEDDAHARLYGFNLKGIREGKAALELGTVPLASELVAPIHATRHGVYVVAADRVVFFRAHGADIGFRPYARREWKSPLWRIAGTAEAPDGGLWLAMERGGVGALFCGNGQSGAWQMRRTLPRWELAATEAAILLAAAQPDGSVEIGFAAGGSMGRYNPRHETVSIEPAPGLCPQPTTLAARIASGLPAVAPPQTLEIAPAVPIYLNGATMSGVSLFSVDASAPRIRPVVPAFHTLASGYASNGHYAGVLPEMAVIVGPSSSDRHPYRAGAMEFGRPGSSLVCVGGAGAWTAVAVRAEANTAKLNFLTIGRDKDLVLQMPRDIMAPGVGRTSIFPTVPPLSTEDAFYLVVERDDEIELLFADMMDPV